MGEIPTEVGQNETAIPIGIAVAKNLIKDANREWDFPYELGSKVS
jgi:hypothetical protein